jgi:hypothetical protein
MSSSISSFPEVRIGESSKLVVHLNEMIFGTRRSGAGKYGGTLPRSGKAAKVVRKDLLFMIYPV